MAKHAVWVTLSKFRAFLHGMSQMLEISGERILLVRRQSDALEAIGGDFREVGGYIGHAMGAVHPKKKPELPVIEKQMELFDSCTR